jgi:hypothetical protein
MAIFASHNYPATARLATHIVNKTWILFIAAGILFLLFGFGPNVVHSSVQQYAPILTFSSGSGPRDLNERLARSEKSWLESVQMRRQTRGRHATPDNIPLYVACILIFDYSGKLI